MHVDKSLLVDSRDKQQLIEQMREMAPFYTPEWSFTPEAPDPGTALFLLFADMYQANIDRLNKVPLKHFIEFLNLVGVSQMPPQPAKSFVAFTLSEGANTPVYLPGGTPITSDQQADGEEIRFEMEHDLMVTPAAIKAVYGTFGQRDWVAKLPSALYQQGAGQTKTEVQMVDYLQQYNQQAHEFYIGHEELFLVAGPIRLTVRLRLAKEPYREREIVSFLADRSRVDWQYYTEAGWKRFEEVTQDGSGIVLVKAGEAPWTACEINGVTTRWLRCALISGNISEIVEQTGGVEISDIRLGIESKPNQRGKHIEPDQLFGNDIELEPASCVPFGEEIGPYSIFYFGSEEAFTKKQAVITLSFTLQMDSYERKPELRPEINWKLIMKKSSFRMPPPQDIYIRRVLWEYWNGQTWVPLPMDAEWEGVFSSFDPAEREVSISFLCPDDWKPTYVNAEHRHWARVRILSADTVQRIHYIYHAPRLKNIAISYRYEHSIVPIQCGLAINNLEVRELSALNSPQPSMVPLFVPVGLERPAYYIGFDRPPEKGPVCLLVSVPLKSAVRQGRFAMHWDYFADTGGYGEWLPVKVDDRTRNMTESGIIRFYVTPETFVRDRRFGQDLYWMRITFDLSGTAAGDSVAGPIVDGLHLNSARVIQQESIYEEIPEKRPGSSGYQLAKFPVVLEEVWVDELDQLSGDDLEHLLAKQPDDIQTSRDSTGALEHAWVRWKRVDLFADSRSTDRHYAINRANGQLFLGDGIHGKAVPREKDSAIKVNYKIVSGKKGNLPKGEIKNLQQMFAFVQAVENPVAASGGCDQETMDEVLDRGAMALRHRNRAVTVEDYEWLAKQASPNIAKVKCLPHVDSRFEKSPGMITLVAMPKEGHSEPAHFAELKRHVEKYLRDRSTNLILFPYQLQVVLPVFLEISVYAMLVVEEMDQALRVEAQAQASLERFLDPIKGNFDGCGWQIGQTVYPSVFYSLLKSSRFVSHVEMLTITVAKVVDQKREEITVDEFEQISFGMVRSGKHKIVVVTQ